MTEEVKPEPFIISEAEFQRRIEEFHPWHECDQCNYDTHRCHFCGDSLWHGSWQKRRIYNHYKQRWDVLLTTHWLSDCRPDLIDGTYDSGVVRETDGPMT